MVRFSLKGGMFSQKVDKPDGALKARWSLMQAED
jgi:hypothetical protein